SPLRDAKINASGQRWTALGMEPLELAHRERRRRCIRPPGSARFTKYQRILPMPISSVANLLAGLKPRGLDSAGSPGWSWMDPGAFRVLGARKKGDDEDEGEGEEKEAGEEEEEEEGDDEELDEFDDEE